MHSAFYWLLFQTLEWCLQRRIHAFSCHSYLTQVRKGFTDVAREIKKLSTSSQCTHVFLMNQTTVPLVDLFHSEQILIPIIL